MVRKSAPASSRCVAKQCLSVCGVTCFSMPALCAACCTASQITLAVIGLSARQPLTVPGNRYVFGPHPAPVLAQGS